MGSQRTCSGFCSNNNLTFGKMKAIKSFKQSSDLLQGIGLVAALVQQAVSRVGGDQRASGVCVVNCADVGSGAVWRGCGGVGNFNFSRRIHPVQAVRQ